MLRPPRPHVLLAVLGIAFTVTASPAQPRRPQAPPATPPGPPALDAKIQETLMGPSVAGSQSTRLSLSEDGDHLSVVTAKGSRQVVLLDGVEGPVFDEIPTMFLSTASIAVQWSPTGGHSAYIGRRGGDFVAVVDGKEALTVTTTAGQQGMSYQAATGWKFWFNRDGSVLAYPAVSAPGTWVMVVNGVKSPAYRVLDFTQIALNGKRLVYVVQTTDSNWHVVVDGKPGPAFAGIRSLMLTADGAHYAYLANRAGVGAQQAFAVVDGVESPAYYGVSDLEQAPDGRVAYIASTKPGDPMGHGGGGALIVSGQTISGNFIAFNGAAAGGGYRTQHVAFSPDGKRYAYIQQNTPNPGVTVMVNGKPMGQTYTQASQLTWSPDGARFAYVGQSPTGSFPVIDGQELSNFSTITEFSWSPDGKHYGLLGYGPNGSSILVDGKEQPKPRGGFTKESLVWSSDSKHFAYGMQVSVANYGPVEDGVVKPGFLVDFAAMNYVQPQITFRPLLFSPDGNHLAYLGQKDAMSRAAVVVDGVSYEGPIGSNTFPAWSPDSKHFATIVTTGRGWTAMIDGKVIPYYPDILKLSASACRFTDARTYRFYGIKDGQIYKVSLDLGS